MRQTHRTGSRDQQGPEHLKSRTCPALLHYLGNFASINCAGWPAQAGSQGLHAHEWSIMNPQCVSQSHAKARETLSLCCYLSSVPPAPFRPSTQACLCLLLPCTSFARGRHATIGVPPIHKKLVYTTHQGDTCAFPQEGGSCLRLPAHHHHMPAHHHISDECAWVHARCWHALIYLGTALIPEGSQAWSSSPTGTNHAFLWCQQASMARMTPLLPRPACAIAASAMVGGLHSKHSVIRSFALSGAH